MPRPFSYASVWTMNGKSKLGLCTIGALVRAFFMAWNTCSGMLEVSKNSFNLYFLRFQQTQSDVVAKVLCLSQSEVAFLGVGGKLCLLE